jgi:hypothetical protein
VRLDEKSVPELIDEYTDIRTEVPTTRGLGTATGGDKIGIKIDPGGDDLMIHNTDDFRYNIQKSRVTRDLHIKRFYLPMKNVKLSGSISKNKLQNYIYLAPGGPLRLKIGTDIVRFVSKTDSEKASLDVTNQVTIHSSNENSVHLYDLRLLFDILKKFPNDEQIELFVNDDLIRLRYEIGNNLGYVNYYQQGKVGSFQTS